MYSVTTIQINKGNNFSMPYADEIKGTITFHAESEDAMVDKVTVEVSQPWFEMSFIGERYLSGEYDDQNVDQELRTLINMCINGEMSSDLIDGINVARNSINDNSVDFVIATIV